MRGLQGVDSPNEGPSIPTPHPSGNATLKCDCPGSWTYAFDESIDPVKDAFQLVGEEVPRVRGPFDQPGPRFGVIECRVDSSGVGGSLLAMKWGAYVGRIGAAGRFNSLTPMR
jgi:hypothetical protein